MRNLAHIGEADYQIHGMCYNHLTMYLVTPREVKYLPNILRARKNLKLTLSSRQMQILIGSILGDGYITYRGQIQLEHSDKYQPYLFWKFGELKALAYGQPSLVERTDKRTGAKYRSYRFWLRQYFRPWRDYFYQKKIKIFPHGFELSPLALAVWYMDDGCYSDGRCTIATECFSTESCQNIQDMLKKQFDLDTHIRSNGKLAIRARSQNSFFSIIRPYVHSTMAYKIL